MRLVLVLVLVLVLDRPCPAGELWVAVGDSGLRLASTDAQTWQHEKRWENAHDPLCDLAFGLGRFLAVGGTETTGHLLASADGQAWRELPVAQKKVTSIAFGRDRFLAAQGPQLLLSADGETFTAGDRLECKEPARVLRIACGDTEAGFRFVLLGQSGPIAGAAPVDWRAVTTDGTRVDALTLQPPATGLAYGAGHFVVVGRNRIESSHDGENWNLQPCPGDLFSAVVWTGARFIATTDGAVWVSTDALTWRRQKAYDHLPILWARDTPAPLAIGLSLAGRLGFSIDFQNWKVLPPETGRIRAVAHGSAAE